MYPGNGPGVVVYGAGNWAMTCGGGAAAENTDCSPLLGATALALRTVVAALCAPSARCAVSRALGSGAGASLVAGTSSPPCDDGSDAPTIAGDPKGDELEGDSGSEWPAPRPSASRHCRASASHRCTSPSSPRRSLSPDALSTHTMSSVA